LFLEQAEAVLVGTVGEQGLTLRGTEEVERADFLVRAEVLSLIHLALAAEAALVGKIALCIPEVAEALG
jgi:hypothetical protein